LRPAEVRIRRAAGIEGGLPVFILPAALLIFMIGGIGPNMPLALLVLAVFVLGTFLLWRPGEPPILLTAFAFQWLQVSVPAFQANLLGVEVNRTAEIAAADIEQATVLSTIGLALLATGMRLGAGRRMPLCVSLAHQTALLYPIRSFFRLYALAFAVAFAAEAAAWIVNGLSQPLLALANLKWAFFWMLGFATFCQPRSPKFYFLAAFFLEFGWGIGGYFSDFKTVFIFVILAAGAARQRLSASNTIGLGLVLALLLGLGVVWTAVKADYRAYVSEGEAAQVVKTGFADRMSKLADLIASLDSRALSDGADALARRIAYVEYFGAILEYVPRVLPHEDGALWWDAMTRPFMPRLFFPEKSSIEDSERTKRYTGIDVAGSDQGTSISIGYFAESYIDFGEVGMMVPIFLLGLLYGSVYRRLLTMPYSRGLLGMALACSVLTIAIFAESSITKVFGGFVLGTLMAWVLARYLVPLFCPWLQVKPGR
jgi:hypothetical protein